MRPKRFHWLAEIINVNRLRIGAEVGAATGITTQHILDHCPTIEKLFIADDWRPIPESNQWKGDNMERIFRKKFGTVQYKDKIHILKGLSWEVAEQVEDESLDFVFIDASHDYESVIKDLDAWAYKLKPGGLLCGHDLHFTGVVEALTERFDKYNETGVDNTWFKWKA